jgi:hypothetical protein
MKVRLLAACLAMLGLAASASAAGVFTENTGHATLSRFSTNTALAPYGWLGVGGAQVWEEYRNFYGGTSDQQVTVTNDPTDPTKVTVHNVTAGSPCWNSAGIFFGPSGNATPDYAKITMASPVDAAGAQTTELRVGFIQTSQIGQFLVNRGQGFGGPGGDGYYGHMAQEDLYTSGPGANEVYMHVPIIPGGTIASDIHGTEETATNSTRTEGSRTVIPVTQSGSLGAGPWTISARLFDSGSGAIKMEVDVGGWSGTIPVSLTAANGDAFAGGSLDWKNVTPVIYIGKRGTETAWTPATQDLYVTPEPATLTLLALGGLAALARRRKETH